MPPSQTELTDQSTKSASESAPSTEQSALEATIHSLRVGLVSVGAALFFLSVFFSLYVYKQNNLLIAQIDSQMRALNQSEPIFESNKQRLGLLLQDLRGYAQTHTDLIPILVNYNFVKVQQQPTFTPQAPAIAPALPSK